MGALVGDWWIWLIETIGSPGGECITVEKNLHPLQNSLE